MPDQPRQLSPGARHLLEQHERNGGRTILGPSRFRLVWTIASCLLLIAGMIAVMAITVEPAAKLFLLALIVLFGVLVLVLIHRMRHPVEYTIDGNGIQIDSPRPSEQDYIPWLRVDSFSLVSTHSRGLSTGTITLHVLDAPPTPDSATGGEPGPLPPEHGRPLTARQPVRSVVLSFSNTYSTERARAVVEMLHWLRMRAEHTRPLEQPPQGQAGHEA